MPEEGETLARLKSLIDRKVEEGTPFDEREVPGRVKQLTGLLALLQERHAFLPGMMVTWKPGMRNKRKPKYHEPAVVVSVLDKPILPAGDEDAGSAYFREPLDLILGFIDEDDGDFVMFHYDSRRFQPLTQQ